jgi:hypothetical protein
VTFKVLLTSIAELSYEVKIIKISAHVDRGQRYRVCARWTLRLAPNRLLRFFFFFLSHWELQPHIWKILSHMSGRYIATYLDDIQPHMGMNCSTIIWKFCSHISGGFKAIHQRLQSMINSAQLELDFMVTPKKCLAVYCWFNSQSMRVCLFAQSIFVIGWECPHQFIP